MCLFAFPNCLLTTCCCCFPLKQGFLVMAVALVILRAVTLAVFLVAPGYENFYPSKHCQDTLVLVVLTVLSCFDIFPLIYGIIKDKYKLVYLYINCELVFLAVNGVFRVYFLAYRINHATPNDERQSARYLSLIAAIASVEAYTIWLACSYFIMMLKKLSLGVSSINAFLS